MPAPIAITRNSTPATAASIPPRRWKAPITCSANGTPEKPIVIKAAGDGEVVFDGGGNFNLFNVKAANYNYFEGLTFRNTEIAIWAGTQFIAGSSGLTVKHCRFENINLGIFTNWAGSSNFTILDNTFIGRDDPELPDGLERRVLETGRRRGGHQIPADAGFLYRGAPLWRRPCRGLQLCRQFP